MSGKSSVAELEQFRLRLRSSGAKIIFLIKIFRNFTLMLSVWRMLGIPGSQKLTCNHRSEILLVILLLKYSFILLLNQTKFPFFKRQCRAGTGSGAGAEIMDKSGAKKETEPKINNFGSATLGKSKGTWGPYF